MAISDTRQDIFDIYQRHVSSGKVAFFRKYRMDFVMGRREGPWLYDLEETKRLFNLHCNGGVFNLGHLNADLVDLLREALEEVDIGNHHLVSRERALLAESIADLMPGDLNYTVFGVGGGEAVDLAIKIARAYTGKTDIISARGGYHGHTGLALATGDEKYRAPFGPQPPGFRQIRFNDRSAAEESIDDCTAAVILETVPATLGMAIPADGYLETVRELCHRKGALLILDEIQTGLGRTGKLWGFEHFNVVPDIVVLGKGLSGGLYPISATVIREPLESVFHPDPFIHISTFGGAEPGCRVARRVLEISSRPEFLMHVRTMADRIKGDVALLQEKHGSFLKGLRQLGLMMALRLDDPMSGPVLTKAAYDNDLLMIYANNEPSCCQFLPPLTITDAQRSLVKDQLNKALRSARRLKRVIKAKDMIETRWRALDATWKRISANLT